MRFPSLRPWRRDRPPAALVRALHELGRLSAEPVEYEVDADLKRIREGLVQLIGDWVPDEGDAAISRSVEEYITSSIARLKADMHVRHDEFLNRYDKLEAEVQPYVDRAATLRDDRYQDLRAMTGAVSHALDRLSDPETPIYDPRDTDEPGEPRP
ncbi:hypothetical protein [Actinoplanes sp. NPDC051851]|uniref:hypothetical protein n=1 Tax=Actinoplanes sp. NPDC051851 TaxID=3154753 RepID=UPI00344A382F